MFAGLVFIVIAIAGVSAFTAPVSTRYSNALSMVFKLKTGSTSSAPAPAPTPAKQTPVKSVASKTVSKAAAVPASPSKSIFGLRTSSSVAAPVKAAVKAAPVKAVAVKKVSPAPTLASGFAGGLVGADIEVGPFDPLGLSSSVSAETLYWYRAAELKHGRVCMLAALGLWIAPVAHFNDPVFDTGLGLGAVTKLYAERPEALWQIVLALAAIETVTLFKDGQGAAGDLGFDPLGYKEQLGLNKSPEKFEAMQLRELKNGRLAMLGTSAILLQEYLSGKGVYEQFN